MKLFCSHTSPYARKCRMLLRLPGTPLNVSEIFLDPFTDEKLRRINPLGKVPALIDGDFTLFDSPLICEYLDTERVKSGNTSVFKHGTKDYFSVQRSHAQANGIIDAAVSMVMEQRRDTEHSEFWLGRWRESIKTSIENMTTDFLGDAEQTHIGTLAAAAALAYLDFRLDDLGWRNWQPSLAQWFDHMSQQDWVSQTQPS